MEDRQQFNVNATTAFVNNPPNDCVHNHRIICENMLHEIMRSKGIAVSELIQVGPFDIHKTSRSAVKSMLVNCVRWLQSSELITLDVNDKMQVIANATQLAFSASTASLPE